MATPVRSSALVVTHGSPYSIIPRLAAPTVFAMLTQSVVNEIDVVFFSRLPCPESSNAQAALLPSLILLWMFGGSLSAISVGTQALAARRIAEGNRKILGQRSRQFVVLLARRGHRVHGARLRLQGSVFVQGGRRSTCRCGAAASSSRSSRRGEPGAMTVRNPWAGQSATVIDGASSFTVVAATTADTFTLPTVAGRWYAIVPTASAAALPNVRVTGTPATAKKTLGAANLGL